jgi:twitching motility protein PilT
VKLLDSLLDAIVRLEGDALVMHVGEKPYVITASAAMNAYRGPLAWGQVELSSRVLTFDAVSSMLSQILPGDQLQALDEYGAIEHEIAAPSNITQRFTVIAARGGEDVWVEVRRKPEEVPIPDEPVVEPEASELPLEIDASELAASVAEELPSPALAASESHEIPSPDPSTELRVGLSVSKAEPLVPSPDLDDHIIVELPGDAATDVPLSGVPDEAFEILDDEPQGVPTEAEVDAMLAATAAALLTSGLAGDQIIDPIIPDDTLPDVVLLDDQASDSASGDAAASIDDGISDRYDLELDPEELIRVDTTPISSYSAPEAAFELSPPSYSIALLEEEYETARPEFAFEPPPGTPLFSEEAVLAAAATPVAESRIEQELGHVEVTYVRVPIDTSVQQAPPPPAAEPLVAAQAPEPESSAPAAAPPLDVTEHLAVWSTAITQWSTEPPVAAAPEPAAPASEPQNVRSSELPDDRATELPSYRIPEVPSYQTTELPSYRTTELPDLRSSDLSNVRTSETPEPAALDTTPPGGDPLSEHIATEPAASLPTQPDTAVDRPEPAAHVAEPAAQPEHVEPRDVEPVAPVEAAEHRADLIADQTHGETQMEATPEVPYQAADETEQPRHAVVVPLSRPGAKAPHEPAAVTPPDDAALMRPLRAAAARGAATLYIVAQSKPMIRVEGEISALEGEPALSVAEVERLVAELAPPRKRDALQTGSVEWLCDVPEVGRVRCLTFRDHRGPGVLFHMFPQRAIAGDQSALPREVQALLEQSDGLVLVSGTRASGKSTLLNAFVDLINNTRSDHVVTVESQIGFVHESRRSFVSQRETRGDSELAAAFARTALHEDPDVMVIEDLKTPDLVTAALDAAESGRLVLASVSALSTSAAVERLIELFPSERREKIRASLAGTLRGVVGQVLVRKAKGGRIAAREILVNTPAVAALVREGNTPQLPSALESGRHHGMVPLTDSLAAQVREGTVHAAEAYRKAPDRPALLEALKRDGIDTSFAERLA